MQHHHKQNQKMYDQMLHLIFQLNQLHATTKINDIDSVSDSIPVILNSSSDVLNINRDIIDIDRNILNGSSVTGDAEITFDSWSLDFD